MYQSLVHFLCDKEINYIGNMQWRDQFVEYLKDINLDIDEYGDCLPRQHGVNF